MAYTKKTNTTVTKVVKEEVAEKKTYNPSDEIMCTSVTAGELIMIGRKTKRYYSWQDYGDTIPVEYQDLKAEQWVSGSKYIYDPLFVIEDEEFINLPENKKIADVYQNVLTADEIDQLFASDTASFKRTVKNLPKGVTNSLKSIAAQKMIDGSLDSLSKIKILDELLGTDLFNCYVAT